MSDFSQYKNFKDKFESLYIFVINNATHDEFNSKIEKIFKIMDNIPDSKKRGFLKSRIYDFQKNINEHNPDENIDGIFFVSDKVKNEKLQKEHKEVLEFFSHPKISYSYGNNFDLDWLNHLITNKEYVNVFQIKNNDIKYLILNETKKKYLYQDTIKSMDVKTIISKNILKNKEDKIDKYFVYGSSTHLKNYQDNNCFQFVNTAKDIDDSEIINYYKMDKFKKNNEELQDIIDKLTHPKFINKVVFGDDIFIELSNSMIEKVYIIEKHTDLEKVKELNGNLVFVKSFNSGDNIDSFNKNYGGIIGLKYY
jgi:hypothetical protein